jgi:aryl-alcohol dehydrogenase-like predicted oxidoreductase
LQDGLNWAHRRSRFDRAVGFWLYSRSDAEPSVMLPIPGTANVSHLEDNVAAAEIKLTDEEFSQLDAISG